MFRHHLEIHQYKYYICGMIKTKIIKNEEQLNYKKVIVLTSDYPNTVFIPIQFDVVIVNIIEHSVVKTLFFTYSMN